jgi:hypothetical protein
MVARCLSVGAAILPTYASRWMERLLPPRRQGCSGVRADLESWYSISLVPAGRPSGGSTCGWKK